MSACNLTLWAHSVSIWFMGSATLFCSGRPKYLAGVYTFTCKVSFELRGGMLASIVEPHELHLSPFLILHHSFSLIELLKYLWFLFQEVHPNSLGGAIYERDIVSCIPMDAIGEDSSTSVCMRSSKLFVLWCDIEKATLWCLFIM